MTDQNDTMAGWLALNGLTVAGCRQVLDTADLTGATTSGPVPDPILASDGLLTTVTGLLAHALPRLAPLVARIGPEVAVDLAPDRKRFPRAFTLHDDGRGLPFVSCPVKGRLSDLLLVGHEIGHALQLLADSNKDLPPVQRETAAYLAEELVCIGIAQGEGPVGDELAALHRARTKRIMDRAGTALRAALNQSDAPYSYDWNYPVARILAARAARHLSPDERCRVFDGTIGLDGLTQLR